MGYHELISPILAHFRRRRMALLTRRLGLTSHTRVLDVGGTPYLWSLSPVLPRVTLLNVTRPAEPLPRGFRLVIGDARALPFRDRSFDVAVSNSVIEHLGAYAEQRRFADEIRRVAGRYAVQTPNRWFPIEPHYGAPGVQFLPKRARVAVAPYTPWGVVTRASPAECNAMAEELRLLTAGELQELFPGARVVRERLLGFTKSIIALECRDPDASVTTDSTP